MTERPERASIAAELGRWLDGEEPSTLGGLIDLFGEKSFALVFVILLGVPALPLPTGGATHVFEIVAMLLALELIVGREEIWLPARWRRLSFDGDKSRRFVATLARLIARLERVSKPRARFLFDHRITNAVFGVLVIAGSLGAFLAPPFSALDTVPALGVVLLSLGMLLEDPIVAVAGTVVGAAGVLLELTVGTAVVHAVRGLF